MGLFDHLFKSKSPPTEEKTVEPGTKSGESAKRSEAAGNGTPSHRADPSAFLHPKSFVPRGVAPLTPPVKSVAHSGVRKPGSTPPPATEEIVLTLGDVLSRIPTPYLKSGAHDPKRELRFNINDLSSDIARGRAAVPLSRIAELVPDIFAKKIGRDEDSEVRLPLQKLVEQIGLLRSKPQTSPNDRTARPLIQLPEGASDMPAPPAELTAGATVLHPETLEPATDSVIHLGSEGGPLLELKPAETTAVPLVVETVPQKGPENAEEARTGPEPDTAPLSPDNIQPIAPESDPLVSSESVDIGPELPKPESQSPEAPSVPAAADLPLEMPRETTTPPAQSPESSAAPMIIESPTDGPQRSPITPEGSVPDLETDSGGEKIHLSLAALLKQCPPEIIVEDLPHVPDNVRITLPFAPIDRQLVKGHVEISAVRFVAALPFFYQKFFSARMGVKVPIPLEEVFQNLPSPAADTAPEDLSMDQVLAPAAPGTALTPPMDVISSPVAAESVSPERPGTEGESAPVSEPQGNAETPAAEPEPSEAPVPAPPPLDLPAFYHFAPPPPVVLPDPTATSPAPGIEPAAERPEEPVVAPSDIPAEPVSSSSIENAAPFEAVVEPENVPAAETSAIPERVAGNQPAVTEGPVAVENVESPEGEADGLPKVAEETPPLPAEPNSENAPSSDQEAEVAVPLAPPSEDPLEPSSAPTPEALPPSAVFAAPTQTIVPPRMVRPFIVLPPPIFGLKAESETELSVGDVTLSAASERPADSVTEISGISSFSESSGKFDDLPDDLASPPEMVEAPASTEPMAEAATTEPAAEHRVISIDFSQALVPADETDEETVAPSESPTATPVEGSTVESSTEPESGEVPVSTEDSITEAPVNSQMVIEEEKSGDEPPVEDGPSADADPGHVPKTAAELESSQDSAPIRTINVIAEFVSAVVPAAIMPTMVPEPDRPSEGDPVEPPKQDSPVAAQSDEFPAEEATSQVDEKPVPQASEAPSAPPPFFNLPAVPAEDADSLEVLPPALPLRRFDQDALQAIFMTEETLDLPKISRLAAQLPGVHACVIATRDQACTGGKLPEGFDLAALLGLAPRVGEAAGRLPIGELKHFTLYGAQYSVSFFERNGLSLCAVHRPRSFVPGVREKLVAIADELSKS